MKVIKVGLLGMGTVGSGVFEVLKNNAAEISRRAGCTIQIGRVVVRDPEEVRKLVGPDIPLSSDPFDIVNDSAIDVLVEVMGGTTLARDVVLAAIAKGKQVVTANKALLAVHGNEIFARAREAGVMVAFEAAVAGGIPIVKALREGLSANRVQMVAGIINGTTNFILSEMRDKGISFDVALAEAQRLGYAEADPTFDIEGIDAAHKATLLASIAFGVPVQFDGAYVEGISKLAAEDFTYADRLGYRIKLLGMSKRREGEGVELRVHPTLIPARRLIANVEGAMNAVLVQGDAVGATLHYGKGAGSEPTASAVIADLVDVTRLATSDPQHRVPHLAFQPGALRHVQVLPIEQVITSYYLRLRVKDETGVLAQVTRILADADISINAVLQRGTGSAAQNAHETDLIILTHNALEGSMNAALARLQQLPAVLAPIVRIRKEELA